MKYNPWVLINGKCEAIITFFAKILPCSVNAVVLSNFLTRVCSKIGKSFAMAAANFSG